MTVDGKNQAVDSSGNPVVVYRGEHGEPGEERFQTRRGSFTFVDDWRAANRYATHPNDRGDTPRVPRVLRATLDIRKPVIKQPDDRFIDGAQIAAAVGEAEARAILIRHAEAIENTDNWYRLGAGFADVRQFLKEHPARFGELYLEAYCVLDDAKAVEDLRKVGYDGAIYGGSGIARNNVEYRVFSPHQVRLASVERTLNCSSCAILPDRYRGAARYVVGESKQLDSIAPGSVYKRGDARKSKSRYR
jgi:hypothetical protein